MQFLNFIENARRYGPHPSTHDVTKFVAVIIMIIDHIGMFFFPEEHIWRSIGRIGFPIWFFLSGYARPSRVVTELYVLSVLMVLADAVTFYPVLPINALLSIAICRWFTRYLDKKDYDGRSLIFIFIGFWVWWLPTVILFEYGTQALMFALCGYLHRKYPYARNTRLAFLLATLSFIALQQINYSFDTFNFLILVFGTGAVVYTLMNFEVRFYEHWRWPWLKATFNFVARNSLYVYFIHFVGFVFLSTYLYPERNRAFQWIGM